MNIGTPEQLEREVGNLIIGSIKSGSLTDSSAAGRLFLLMMNSIFRRNQGHAGEIFSCGNTHVVSRKNFVAGVDEDGFYTKDDRQRSDRKVRKLELDDIKGIDIEEKKEEPPEEVPHSNIGD
jgi:hypothetical protein